MSDLTDTAQTTTGDAAAAASPGNGRLVLALIAGIPLTVILAASWMWYFVVNGELDIVGALGTANRGELVQPPRQALDAGWTSPDGTAFALAPAARWTLVIPQAQARCAEACERRLYEVRQIHQALGKTMNRVQRALVTPAAAGEVTLAVDVLSDERPLPEDFASYLARDQRGLAVWHSDAKMFTAMFPELPARPDSWYLMDPAGWVMMRYDDSVSYKEVIADIKFLLKNSNG
jgi:hypothetical protein